MLDAFRYRHGRQIRAASEGKGVDMLDASQHRHGRQVRAVIKRPILYVRYVGSNRHVSKVGAVKERIVSDARHRETVKRIGNAQLFDVSAAANYRGRIASCLKLQQFATFG